MSSFLKSLKFGASAAALTALVLFAAAPSRADDAAPGVKEAQGIVDAHLKTPEFWAPPAFDASKARGKSVWWISDYKTNILKQWAIQGEKAAADAGLNFHL